MAIQLRDAYVTIASVNLEKMTEFYSQLLSQKPTKYIPNVYAEFEISNLKLGIFKPKSTHESEFANSEKSKISFCLEVNDLESAINHFTEIGFPPPGKIYITSHGREIYAYDPDGNRIILHNS